MSPERPLKCETPAQLAQRDSGRSPAPAAGVANRSHGSPKLATAPVAVSRRAASPLVVAFLTMALRPAAVCLADEDAFRVPPGFVIAEFAGDELAHDIFSLTLDPRGRPVVSGPGYVRILCDDDRDGRAERAIDLAGAPKTGAQGLLWVDDSLWFTGDRGLWRIDDTDGDGLPDRRAEAPLLALDPPEHGAHGLAHGPDGWIYLVCGNDAGLDRLPEQTHPRLPRRARAGGILRFRPTGQWQLLADGFRNPYDLVFGASGELFTVDSDGERVEHLPWYEPTRLFDVAIGRAHGWLEEGWVESWSQPAWFPDSVPRVAELGRGSPTGMECYRHHRWPARYQGGVLSACWTLGRVYHCPLEPSGSSFTSQGEVLLETVGEVGFAPVDLAVGSAGELWVAIGGRGTRGGVFRLDHVGSAERSTGPDGRPDETPGASAGARTDNDAGAPGEPLGSVLAAPQPLAAWSRAVWQPLADRMGAEVFRRAVADESLPLAWRVRAVEVLVDRFTEPLAPWVQQLMADQRELPSGLAARLAWALEREAPDASAMAVLGQCTSHADPVVARAAWQALVLAPALVAESSAATERSRAMIDFGAGFDSPDSRVRLAAALVARDPAAGFDPSANRAKPARAETTRWRLSRAWRQVAAGTWGAEPDAEAAECLSLFAECSKPEERLECVRLIQLALGDAVTRGGSKGELVGYCGRRASAISAPVRRQIIDRLAPAFPSGTLSLDRELTRVLAWIEADDPALLDRVTTQWTAETSVASDLHYLMVAARLSAARGPAQTARICQALLALHPKLAAARQFPSRAWPEWVGLTAEQLLERDPALAVALIESPAWGWPEHALFAGLLTGESKTRAARRLLAAVAGPHRDLPWNTDLVELLGQLPAAEVRPVLGDHVDDWSVRSSVIRLFARWGVDEDRPLLLTALDDADPDLVRRAADALARISPAWKPEELAMVLRAGQRLLAQVPSGAEAETPSAELERRRLVQTFAPACEALADLLAGAQLALANGNREGVVDPSAGTPDTSPGEAGLEPAERLRRLSAVWLSRLPELAAEVQAAPAGSVDWRRRLAQVDWEAGDETRGAEVFARRQCAACHSGTRRLGPSLSGAAQRFSREDLWLAIVDPHRQVAPPYRSTLFLTRKGQVVRGLVVYESPESTLIQTGPTTTVRVVGDDLAARRESAESLMPAGLLDGATDQELADLNAYLHRLRPDDAR